MIRRLLPLLLLLCLAAPGSAILLNETHGSTWISWDWNVTELAENQRLIGEYDGAEVLNLSSASRRPLPTSYAVSGIGSSEPHIFALVLYNTSADPMTAEEVQSSLVWTAQAESNFFLYLGAGVVLFVLGMFLGRSNRIVALFLLVVALFAGGYTAAATAGSNVVLFGFGLMVVLLSLAGMVFTFLDMTRERRGWGE